MDRIYKVTNPYFLTITNPQGETTTLVLANFQDAVPVIKAIEDSDSCCLYQLYSTEYEAIIRSHNNLGVIEKCRDI